MRGIVLFLIEKVIKSLKSIVCRSWRMPALSDFCMKELLHPFKLRLQLFDEVSRRHHVLRSYHASFDHYPEIGELCFGLGVF